MNRLYLLSAELHKLTPDLELLDLQAYRYKFFVDSSSVDCKYAKATANLYNEQEKVKTEAYIKKRAPSNLESILALL